jgi:glycine cleavage system H protein
MNIFYTQQHEWIKVEGNTGTIGISTFAAKQLGDITFIELPDKGKSVKQFAVLCAIESVKAASDIYSPLSGKVSAVNTDLENAPQIINESPEEKGWIAKLELTDLKETSKLMNPQQYQEYLKGQE